MKNTSLNFIPPYVNGSFVSLRTPERVFSLANPAYPNDILAHAGWSQSLVSTTIEGMKPAQRKFSFLSYEERFQYIEKLIGFLKENAEEIKSQMMLELSRSRFSVEEEWSLCEELFSILPNFCKKALVLDQKNQDWPQQPVPMGLALIAVGLSLPVYSLLSTVLPSLVAGNAVCFHISSHCLLSGSLIASGFHQAAFPAGVVQIIYGEFDIFRKFVLSREFDVVLYTGGEENREQLRRDTFVQQNLRLVLSGGGKNVACVTPTATLNSAAESIVYGMCVDAGQRLESTGLVFVEKSIFSQFQDILIEHIKKMPIGVKEDLSRCDRHVMEPLCSSHAWERFLRFQGIAAREANETLRWGKSIDNVKDGYFVSPGVHLMTADRVLKSVYASHAFFGPDVCLVPIDDHDQAISILEGLDSIRSFSLHATHFKDFAPVLSRSCAPTVLLNETTTKVHPLLPQVGRENAKQGNAIGLYFLYSTFFRQTQNGFWAEKQGG